MGDSEKKQIIKLKSDEMQEQPDLFADGRLVLASGEDIQMIHYHQQQELEKNFLSLNKNLLSFVIQGQKQIFHELGKITILPSEGFFLQKGAYLRTERCSDTRYGFEAVVIMLSDSFLQSLTINEAESFSHAAPIGLQPANRAFQLHNDNLVTGLIDQFIQYFRMPGEKDRIEAILPLKIREMIMLLASSGENKGFGALLKNLSYQQESGISALMEAHFRESLGLEQWAFLAGLSLSSFKRKFESIYHQPPRRWIQLRRLQEAWRLLANEQLNVTEVCFEVGFENLAHFVHAFKEQYRITPKQRQLKAKKPVAAAHKVAIQEAINSDLSYRR
jgi:AraC-like DNA-binding protein